MLRRRYLRRYVLVASIVATTIFLYEILIPALVSNIVTDNQSSLDNAFNAKKKAETKREHRKTQNTKGEDELRDSPPSISNIRNGQNKEEVSTGSSRATEDSEPVGVLELSNAANETTQANNRTGEKYWFFKNGTIWPTRYNSSTGSKKPNVWPQEDPNSDRVVEQLMYIPESYDSSDVKLILLVNALESWNVPMGDQVFRECPVNACTLTSNLSRDGEADVVLFRDFEFKGGIKSRSPNQLWIVYLLESPHFTYTFVRKSVLSNGTSTYKFDPMKTMNWTATYRWDSEVVTPIEKWVYYNENVKTLPVNRLINFAAGKTHKVAWFVSHCHVNNNRLEYARELGKYINVDIYGKCGFLDCNASKSQCFELLKVQYKFYLAFENSNCKDYITEKIFVNGLGNNVIPIVMGAPKSDYIRSVPLNSFIYAEDFESPRKLADYLHLVDTNDTLYNSYFQWQGTGELINTYFWCRLCTMLHDSGSVVSGKYLDLNEWWSKGVCKERLDFKFKFT